LMQHQLKEAELKEKRAVQELKEKEMQMELLQYQLKEVDNNSKVLSQELKDKELQRELIKIQLAEAKKNKWYLVGGSVLISSIFQFVISNFDRVLGWFKELF